MANVPLVKMNNGLFMPGFGLGTFEAFGEAAEATKYAIDAGYRHFDSVDFDGVVKRDDIFIVTKLWNTDHEPENIEISCRKSSDNLGLGYIDLYLMHYPVGFVKSNPFEYWPKNADGSHAHSDVDYIDTWKGMENLVKIGLVKSIGISNFNSLQIDRLLDNCEIKPVNNQIEISPNINQKKLITFCQNRNILVTAYCPLGRPIPSERKPDFLYNSKIKSIADKYDKTPAQVVFRYLIEIGSIPIPKSANKIRIEENINVFDFHLTKEEIELIDSFNTGERVIHFNESKGHKYWPFDIDF